MLSIVYLKEMIGRWIISRTLAVTSTLIYHLHKPVDLIIYDIYIRGLVTSVVNKAEDKEFQNYGGFELCPLSGFPNDKENGS
jgi:hypothetical protein